MSPRHHTPGMGLHGSLREKRGLQAEVRGSYMCGWGAPYVWHQQPSGDAALDSGAGFATLELCDLRPLIEPLWAPGR